ncbi:MAG: hypothetical protein U5K79_14850 [Cyclobacteriaceae bacterium]|nr:hypothetical protein [Cyclobacteriaceae bacterium]
MKALFTKYTLLTMLFLLVFAIACKEDDPEPEYNAPSITAPASTITLENGAPGQSVNFTVSVDPALTATFAATGTGVTIANASGSISGTTLTINFAAGTTAGAGSIKVVVTDSEGQSDDATAVLSIDPPITQITVTSNITQNQTWTSDKIYILGGRITVVSGVTLTIDAGTIIKGQAGTGANATALLVARGGKLKAEGTAAKPIIFTSIADEIDQDDMAAGNFGSPNLDPDVNGLWGGVIILGKAKISASNASGQLSEIQVEGIPTSDPNGLYGGTDDADDSGTIKYISIRHGGTNIGSGNEINGLTLGGVGSTTVIENVEVVANQDDGIEWFGGTVNVKNVVVWNVGDDGIDTDQSWSGTLDNFVVVTPTGHCFELDGPEGTYSAGHTIQNGTIVVSSADRVSEDIINTDANSIVALKGLYFKSIKAGQIINRVDAQGFFRGYIT